MLHQSAIKPNGFRELGPDELGVVSGGSGNEIVVTGNRGDAWTISVSPDDLALLGIFNFGGGDGLPGTADQFGGDGGGGGGAPPSEDIYPEEARKQALDANEDSERQEAVERTLEALMEEVDPGDSEWTFEFSEQFGDYQGFSSDGRSFFIGAEQAEAIFDQRVA